MEIKILFFGITTDIVGVNSLSFKLNENSTILDLKNELIVEFVGLKNMSDFAIAVNEEYAEDDCILMENDIVAIIPPVSGG